MRSLRHRIPLCALAVAAALPPAAAAAAPTPAARAASCQALLGQDTIVTRDTVPWRRIPQAGSLAQWPAARRTDLPRRVWLRSEQASYNERYQFATRGGDLFVAPRAGGAPGWRRMPLPACFAGHVASLSADDDELIAVDDRRRVFSMDNALKGPDLFRWTRHWGPPLWHGPGRTLPRGVIAWSWSVLSPAEDRTWTDTAGNRHAVGGDKVSHIWALRTGGQRLTFMDPWLPADDSYEMCGPERGRFRAVGLSASGSTVFVIGRQGDMFTRLYDFDISGSDPIFFDYSYRPQRRGDPDAVIQLPSPGWVRQPKVPGRITSAISIEKRGRGAIHRTLRVAGLDARGHTGFWQKDSADLRASAWRFHRTGGPLPGRRLADPRRDTAREGLGPSADIRFAGRAGDLRVTVPDFNLRCTPATLRLRAAGGPPVDLVLHNVDGLRQQERATALDGTPREQYGEIEVPGAVRARLAELPPAIGAFIRDALAGRRFTPVTLHVTTGALSLDQLGWTLRRR